jgi:hypothetical protein
MMASKLKIFYVVVGVLKGLAKQQSILIWVTIYVAEDSKKYC